MEAILQLQPALHAVAFGQKSGFEEREEKWKLTQQRGNVEKVEKRIGPH